MKVQDLIGSRQEVFSIVEEMTVHEAAKYLRQKQLRSAGVTDTNGMLVGVVSQSDISDKVAAENKCPAWMKVSEIMTRELITVSPEARLDECLRSMEKNGVYHLLVVDGNRGFRGMLSVSDILRVIALDEKERADLLEAILFPVH
jgi:predicted transcriptional regulator